MFYRQGAPDAEQAAGADADSEHDPRVARRASLAGLRREAAAPLLGANRTGHGAGGAVSAAAKHEAQHDHASEESREAVKAALQLSASRIDGYSVEIRKTADHPPAFSEAGVEPILLRFLAMFSSVGLELDRMNGELKALDPAARRALQGELVLLRQAAYRFANVWEAAKKFAQKHGELERLAAKDPEHFRRRADDLYSPAAVPATEKGKPTWNHTPVIAVQEDALRENVEAVLASAQAVQLGLTAGDATTAREDLHRMIWHLREVASIVEQDPTGKLRRQQSKQLGAVVQAVRAAQLAISGRSALTELAKQLDLSLALNKLQP